MAIATMDSLVIDRVYRFTMFNSSTQEAMWSLLGPKNSQLSVTSDTEEATDALGAPIMIFNRAKRAQFTGSAALLNLSLLAAQSGGERKVSSNTSPVKDTPYFDYPVAKTADTLELTHTPAGTFVVPFVYRLNKDGSLGQKFALGDAVGEGTYTLTGKTITFNAGAVAVGDKFHAFYTYTADGAANNGAIEVVNNAVDFPKAGYGVAEVYCYDPCDQSTKYYAYVVMPAAKLSSDFDFTFAADTEHPFTIDANQDYCDDEKQLFRVVVPELSAAA